MRQYGTFNLEIKIHSMQSHWNAMNVKFRYLHNIIYLLIEILKIIRRK